MPTLAPVAGHDFTNTSPLEIIVSQRRIGVDDGKDSRTENKRPKESEIGFHVYC
jgi:hypothetical protein